MMSNRWMYMVVVVLIGLSLAGCASFASSGGGEANGSRKEGKNRSYKEKIESTVIRSFAFEKEGDYSLKCTFTEEDVPFVSARGGGQYGRDGSGFWLEYETDSDFPELLQQLTIELQLSKDNGHTVHVNGLPPCGGETINITYESGEKIYRANNQSALLKKEESDRIYEAFHQDAIAHGLDFTTEGSNMQLFDDADTAYLQGSWSGTHFGDTCRVEFEGHHVRIYINDTLTDDCDYQVVEGRVVPDNGDEYPEFSQIKTMTKSTESELTGHFYDKTRGSSTVRLLKN